jgi:hypothetical protein
MIMVPMEARQDVDRIGEKMLYIRQPYKYTKEEVDKIVRDIEGEKRRGAEPFYWEDVEIGMGELIFYSFLPSHVEAYYGSDLLVVTLLMTGIGVALNLWILEKRRVVSGLPAPIFLGLAPLIISLIL